MATALPQANARLTKIAGPGFSEDAELPATEGATRWEGASDAYVTEKIITSTAQGRLDRLKRTTIIIPGDLRPPVALAQGDAVTYSYAGESFTRRVIDFQAHLLPGVPQTVRIELENA